MIKKMLFNNTLNSIMLSHYCNKNFVLLKGYKQISLAGVNAGGMLQDYIILRSNSLIYF